MIEALLPNINGEHLIHVRAWPSYLIPSETIRGRHIAMGFY